MSPKVMNCPHCGRILPEEFWHEKKVDKPIVICPKCGGTKTWKDAKRYTPAGAIQRYYCRICGHRFSKV
jgi:transcription elongation factor Elf1